MAQTKVTYQGNGSTRTFSVPFPYLSTTHVRVAVNETPLEFGLEWELSTPSTVQFLINAPGDGDLVKIYRETAIDQREVDFQNGAVLTEEELDRDSLQAFYLLQETVENYSDLVNNALTDLATNNGVIPVEPDQIIGQLVNTVLNSQLAASLQQRITDIDTNAANVLAALQAVNQEILDRVAGDTSLQAQIDGINTGAAQSVFVQGEEPEAGVNGIPNPIPTFARWYDSDNGYKPHIWDSVGDEWVEISDPQVAINEAAITSLQAALTSAENGVSVNAAAISTLDATVVSLNNTVASISAAVTQLTSDLTSAEGDIAANAAATTAIESRVTAAEGQISSQATDITTLQSDITDAENATAANASAISTLQTDVTQNGTDIATNATDITAIQTTLAQGGDPTANAAAIQQLNTELDAAESNIAANASSITQLQADVSSAQSDATANASAISGLDAEVTANENAIAAAASDITSLTAAQAATDSAAQANSSAISSLDTRVTAAEGVNSTQASQITTLQSDLTSAEGDIAANASAAAGLQTSVTDNANSISAQATQVSSLSSSVGSLSSTVSSLSTTTSSIAGDVATLQAEYGVTLNVNGYITGFRQFNNGSSGSFDILADRFAIIDPTNDGQGAPVIPFAVTGGQVVMQNVIISGDLFVGGAIQNDDLGNDCVGSLELIAGSIAQRRTIDLGAGSPTLDGTWREIATFAPAFQMTAKHRLVFDSSGLLPNFSNGANTNEYEMRLLRDGSLVWQRDFDHVFSLFSPTDGEDEFIDNVEPEGEFTYTLECRVDTSRGGNTLAGLELVGEVKLDKEFL